MTSSKSRFAAHEKSIGKREAPPSKADEYQLLYASQRVEKEFQKAFAKLPERDLAAIKAAIRSLKKDPRQKAKKLQSIPVKEPHIAQYRLRVGDYRVLYDIDDANRAVVLLVIARRNERTY